MFKYFAKIITTTFIIIGISACGGDDSTVTSAGTTIIASGVVADSTVVIDTTTSSTLTNISADQSTITFTGTDATKESIDIGDIVAIGATADTPDGLLRRVTAVTYNGDQTIFTTTQGTLAEAVESAHIVISGELDPDDIENSTSGAVGVSISKANQETVVGVLAVDASKYKFQTTLKDTVLYDADNDLNTTYDQIVANGQLLFNMKYHFEIDVDNFQIQKLLFTITPNEYSDLNISTNIPSPGISKTKTLKTITMRPFTVQIGALPIIVRPILDLNIGIDGSIELGVSTGISQSASITGGLEYSSNSWNIVSSESAAFDYEAPQITANASVVAYVGPTLTLQIYGVVGPNSNAEGYLSFNADVVNDPWWTLYGGIRLGAGIEVAVLGHNIASYSVPDIIGYEVLLAQSSPMPPTNISVTPGIGDISISWDASPDATKYNLYWDTQPGVQIDTATKIANVTSPFKHTGRTNSTTYYYVLTAENSFGESSQSEEVEVTTLSEDGPIEFLGKTYFRVTSPFTGKIWLDRNLGADQVCTSINDSSCYGYYYQWGRGNDGHQLQTVELAVLNNYTVDAETVVANSLSGIGSIFYSNSYSPYDWTSIDSDGATRRNYWGNSSDGVCPAGFRVPTIDEITSESTLSDSTNNTDLFNIFLKLPTAGRRTVDHDVSLVYPYIHEYSLYTSGDNGPPPSTLYIWSNTPVLSQYSPYYSRAYAFNAIYRYTAKENSAMQHAHPVRCIKGYN